MLLRYDIIGFNIYGDYIEMADTLTPLVADLGTGRLPEANVFTADYIDVLWDLSDQNQRGFIGNEKFAGMVDIGGDRSQNGDGLIIAGYPNNETIGIVFDAGGESSRAGTFILTSVAQKQLSERIMFGLTPTPAENVLKSVFNEADRILRSINLVGSHVVLQNLVLNTANDPTDIEKLLTYTGYEYAQYTLSDSRIKNLNVFVNACFSNDVSCDIELEAQAADIYPGDQEFTDICTRLSITTQGELFNYLKRLINPDAATRKFLIDRTLSRIQHSISLDDFMSVLRDSEIYSNELATFEFEEMHMVEQAIRMIFTGENNTVQDLSILSFLTRKEMYASAIGFSVNNGGGMNIINVEDCIDYKVTDGQLQRQTELHPQLAKMKGKYGKNIVVRPIGSNLGAEISDVKKIRLGARELRVFCTDGFEDLLNPTLYPDFKHMVEEILKIAEDDPQSNSMIVRDQIALEIDKALQQANGNVVRDNIGFMIVSNG